MTDDPDPKKPGFGDLESPFLFVPHGAPEPTEWMRKHPGWVKFPATFVPRAPAAVRMIPGTNRPWPLDKRGQPWPRSRFGQPLRPLDEYPPGMRAPGERYTGPIADPNEAMRAAMASEDMLAQAAKLAADPDAPIRAYLSAMELWKDPGKYALSSRLETIPGPARVPSQAERNADAIRVGMGQARAADVAGVVEAETKHAGSNDFRGRLRGLVGEAGLARFDALSADEQRRLIAQVGSGLSVSGRSPGGVDVTQPRIRLASAQRPATDAVGALPGLENYRPNDTPSAAEVTPVEVLKQAAPEVGGAATRSTGVADDPVQFVDDLGNPILDENGEQMSRPAGLDPGFFVRRGLQDKQAHAEVIQGASEGGGPGVLGNMLGALTKFKQGGPWDAQRVGGRFRPEYVDYATVAIGLYAAANGMSEEEILTISNIYAALFSRYSRGTKFDETYTFLPARNVNNTRLGYELYRSGRVRAMESP